MKIIDNIFVYRYVEGLFLKANKKIEKQYMLLNACMSQPLVLKLVCTLDYGLGI